jgi:hypothetical protein
VVMDAEMPTVYREETPVARKEYKCCECCKPILPGQKYIKYTGLWEGKWSTYRWCIHCEHLRSQVFDAMDYPSEGIEFGRLHEIAKEMLVDYYPEDVVCL